MISTTLPQVLWNIFNLSSFDLSYLFSLLIPTALATVALIIAVELVHERPHILRAFILAFIANYSVPFFSMIFGTYFATIPFGFYIINMLLWITLVKLFFFRVSLWHAVLIGALGYGINLAFIFFGLDKLVLKILT
jgi:hypothetical protein